MASNDILLAPGEKGLYSRSFRPNLILFWLETTMTVTNRRIVARFPNTVLGIIPLGYEERSMPMGSVAGVTTSMRVRLGRVVFGGILTVVSLMMFFGTLGSGGFNFAGMLFSLLLTLVFLAITLGGIQSALVVTNNGGGVNQVTVSVADKAALDDFRNHANEIIYSATTPGTSWNEAMQNGYTR